MAHPQKILIEIAIGTALSSVFFILLVRTIMAGGVGTSITFTEFLSTPENIIFCLTMISFMFAAFMLKSANNRLVIICWTVGAVIQQSVFWGVYKYFYYQSTNIYVLNLAGLVSSIPIVLFMRYRVSWSTLMALGLIRLGWFEQRCDSYIRLAKTTDFERSMERVLLVGFCIEFLYSLYLSLYALVNRIPVNGSLDQHFNQYNSWDPFDFYYWLLNLVSCLYVLIISFYLYREQKHPDIQMHSLSAQQRRETGLKLLAKRRAKVHKTAD